MSGTSEPDWDLDELKARIREQAVSMRERVASDVPLAAQLPTARAFNWLEAKSRLKFAGEHAQLDVMPTMPRFHGIKRRLALAASRLVLYLTRFFLRKQNEVNVCVLDVLRDAGEALHTIETRVVQQQEQIRLLEATITQLQLRIPYGPGRFGELERKAS